MSRTKQILIIVSFIVPSINPSFANWRENAKAVDVSGGEDHTLVLTVNKWPWTCGPNGGPGPYSGVLGIGSADASLIRKTLVRVHDGDMNTPSDYLEDINDVDAGWKHSLALERYNPSDPNYMGYVWAWGNDGQGQLGNGPDGSSTTPVQVLRGEQTPTDPNDPNLVRIVDISAGRSGEHSLAVDVNGYAYAWGYNEYGQCGNDESQNNKLTPVYVHRGEQPEDPYNSDPNLTRIIAVSAGEWHSMVLEAYDPCDPNLQGRVYTWGDDTFKLGGAGVLGAGGVGGGLSTTPLCVHNGAQDYNEPSQEYLKHIVAISAGWDHSMALEKYVEYDSYQEWLDPCGYTWPDPNHRGRVYTWGNNGDTSYSDGGRLGDGSTASRSTPVVVHRGEQPPDEPNDTYPYLSHIIAISAGEGHSMALDVNGYVYTWGDNTYGQLGDGNNTDSTTPVRVVGEDGVGDMENIVAISAGYWHSLAIDDEGVIWTWGKTLDGRLGLANMAFADPCVCDTPHRVPAVYNITQETFHFAIQPAIDKANTGDILEASTGVYYERVDFNGMTISLRSEDANNPDVVADTIVDAQYNEGSPYAAVVFDNSSGPSLAGLTIANSEGAGIRCKGTSSGEISNCVIQGNLGDGIYLEESSVDIRDCQIRGNASGDAFDYHGVYCISASDVNLVNCIVADNDGNGICCNQSVAAITNCSVADNDGNGIYCNESTAAITNCTVEDNGRYGIEVYSNCDLTIAQSLIKGNGKSGLYARTDCDFVLNGSIVCDNGWDGVDLEYNNPETLTNNWIYNNGRTHGTWCDGIWFVNGHASAPVVRNNTIFGNPTYGIHVNSEDTDPNILNCIIYGNGTGDLYGGTFSTVNYSCLQNVHAGTGNISSDPCLIEVDANNFHLAANSPCIDSGDPGFEADANETDIDGEQRVINDRVDMGADEFYWSAADVNDNGLVNFVDYALLTAYWQDAGVDYNAVFLYGDVNSVSLEEFCDEWLWEAGFLTGPMPLMAGRGGGAMIEGAGLEEIQDSLYEIAAAEEKPPVAEAVSVEYLLDWLAEIWLDPEVHKAIDAEAWLKLYLSLKE